MKKIIPIVSLISAGLLLTGCSSAITTKNDDFKSSIYNFKQQLEDYSFVQDSKITQTALNKYALTLDLQEESTLKTLENLAEDTPAYDTTESTEMPEQDLDELEKKDIENEDLNENIDEAFTLEETLTENDESNEISALYYLNEDIIDSCEEFCELKEEITDAIVETESLINKIQNKEIELTREQRIFLTNQSEQLKNLSNQLSIATNELSFSLSELNSLINSENGNIDNVSFKYLAILNNLINSNEMLHNGLSSLNMMNKVFRINQSNIPENNRGRILYGFQQNNQAPIIKDYYIDENGEIIENTPNSTDENAEKTETSDTVATSTENETSNKNTDTYKNRKLQSNIDTYGNFGKKNIDTFFNTALLDNEFMYGNGGYGYNGFAGGYPYLAQQNYNYSQQNQATTNGNTITNNTQNVDTSKTTTKENKFKLTKNVDTYRDASTPTLKTTFTNIKNSVSSFFNKFKKPSRNIENPVYKIPGDEV